jgi:tetratricopeptide (TPR) repeat protein
MMDLRDQNSKAARTRIDSAVAKQPDNVGVLLVAARTYATIADKPLAEKTLKRAIELSPSRFEAYDLLGRLYASEGRAAEAIAEFNQIVARQPNSIAAHTMIGVLLESQNKRDEARKQYEQVIALDSRAPVAANNLAWIYAETGGNLDVALQLAQAARDQLPDTPEVQDTLGWIYYKKGFQTLAIASFRASVDKDPKNATYLTHLGLAYAKNGDVSKARETLENALKTDPNAHGADEARKFLGAFRS